MFVSILKFVEKSSLACPFVVSKCLYASQNSFRQLRLPDVLDEVIGIYPSNFNILLSCI